MQKKSSLFVGLFLILLGILSLGGNIGMSLSRQAPHSFFQLWPVIIIGMGLLFVMPPLFIPQKRGLGGLFIPGLPILVTGGILFAASLSNHWSIWGTMWPLEVIGVALGLALAAIFIRVIWLVIPAFIIGFVGLALQFTAMTGLWASWAILWTFVPLSLGLAFLVIGLKEHLSTLTIVGMGFCGFSGLAFAGLSVFPVALQFANLIAPTFVILMGAILIAIAFWKHDKSDEVKQNPSE
jgi:hypothetical protein